MYRNAQEPIKMHTKKTNKDAHKKNILVKHVQIECAHVNSSIAKFNLPLDPKLKCYKLFNLGLERIKTMEQE